MPINTNGIQSLSNDIGPIKRTNWGEIADIKSISKAYDLTMTSRTLENHTDNMPIWLTGPGTGFGLGYGVIVDRGKASTPLSEGSAYWGGAYCTISWIDRKKDLVGLMMTQVRPYTHINIREEFQVLAYQALVE